MAFSYEIVVRDHLLLLKFRFAHGDDDVLFLPPAIVQQLRDAIQDAWQDQWMDDESQLMAGPVILDSDRDPRLRGISSIAHNILVHCDPYQVLMAALLDPRRAIYRCLRFSPAIGISLLSVAAYTIESEQI